MRKFSNSVGQKEYAAKMVQAGGWQWGHQRGYHETRIYADFTDLRRDIRLLR